MISAHYADKVGTAPGTSTITMPYATPSQLRGGLGVISEVNPWMTGRTTTPPGLPGTVVVKLNNQGGAAGLMGTRAGVGFINNEIIRSLSGNQLGITPTDEELASIYGYTPVEAGWIAAKGRQSISALGGVLDDITTVTDLQKRQVLLQTITAGAFVALAAVSVFRFFKDMKHTPAY